MIPQLSPDYSQPDATPSWFTSNAPPPAAGAPPAAGTSTAPTGQPPPAAPSTTGGGSGDPDAFRAAWFASPYPKNTDGLKQFVAANPQYGATITGSKGSKVLIGGQAFQAVRSAGINGGIGPAWDPLGAEGGGGAAGGGGMDFGSFAKPFGKEFSAPTAEEARNTPGYQFAIGEGLKAIDTGAAAHGTLLTGGNIKDRIGYATGMADQNYQTGYQNKMQEYMNAYNIFRNDNNDIFGRYNTLADRGTRAADSATS